MFLQEHIPALFKKGTLKLLDDAGDIKRVAEATFVIEPFPASLAHELGEEIAGHLFDADGAIRDELEAIDLRLRVGLQRVTARMHPETAATVLVPVSVKDCAAKRIEDQKTGRARLAFSFVLVFDLADKGTRNFVIDQFGNTLRLTFETLQRDLLGGESLAAATDAAARLAATCSDGGSLRLSGPGVDVTLTKNDAKRLRRKAAELRRKGAH